MNKVTVFDVAVYILEEMGNMSAMKLQKLVYYCQAWNLVWEEKPLYNENIEAWANGPVVPKLYQAHRQIFEVSSEMFSNKGNSDNLTPTQKKNIDKIIKFYGDKSSKWLSELTHKEAPWMIARKGLKDLERGNNIISLNNMMEYYESL